MLVEKGIINIKLAKAPLEMECNAEYSTDSDGIYHGTKSLVKINTRLLLKAFANKLSFILSNRSIRICLMRKNPFVAHYVLPWARGGGGGGGE